MKLQTFCRVISEHDKGIASVSFALSVRTGTLRFLPFLAYPEVRRKIGNRCSASQLQSCLGRFVKLHDHLIDLPRKLVSNRRKAATPPQHILPLRSARFQSFSCSFLTGFCLSIPWSSYAPNFSFLFSCSLFLSLSSPHLKRCFRWSAEKYASIIMHQKNCLFILLSYILSLSILTMSLLSCDFPVQLNIFLQIW